MDMQNDLISVIVPIYQIDQYVGFCIESLIRQSYRNLEIILVDDGSTDRCPELCDLYAKKDSRIKVIHKPNGGLVSARKAGVMAASGVYIGYVDGDDWVEPDFYEVMYEAAVKAKADIVCAGFSKDLFNQHIRCSNQMLDGIYQKQGLAALYQGMLSYEQTFQVGITTYVWNKLFRTDILKEVQATVDDRITIGEDAAVTYPALLKSECVYVCDNCSYHYRQREGSMLKVHNRFVDEITKIRYLYENMAAQFEMNEHSESLMRQLTDFILSICIMRSGGIVHEPFKKKFENKRVVIVQAGTFGQVIYDRLTSTNYCEVVGWYDEDYWEYRRCCMNVDSLTDISNRPFDYVLIAKMDQEEIERIRQALIRTGIAEEKILSVDYSILDRTKLLQEYFDQAIP